MLMKMGRYEQYATIQDKTRLILPSHYRKSATIHSDDVSSKHIQKYVYVYSAIKVHISYGTTVLGASSILRRYTRTQIFLASIQKYGKSAELNDS